MRHVYRVLLGFAIATAACSKGQYATGGRQGGDADRGEVNGRMFDFVSNKPDGDDWQIRIRGSAMWASYSKGNTVDDLGTRNLTDREAERLWRLIDALALEQRKKGKKDEDEGYVQLRLREPGGEDGHEFVAVFVSRADADDDVIDLAEYLRTLVAKYHGEKPNF